MDDESIPFFLKPAVHLMNRLNFVWKFSFVSVFLLLPLFVLGVALFNEIQRNINTTHQEQKGLNLLIDTFPLFFDASAYRDFVIVQRVDQSEKVLAEVKTRQTKVSQTLENLATTINSQASPHVQRQFKDLQKTWKELTQGSPGIQGGPNIQFQYYNTFIDAIELFIRVIAYDSKLVHDPDLSTFFLINLILRELPDVADELGRARGYGAYALHIPTVDYETYKTLDKIYDDLLKNVSAYNNSLSFVFTENFDQEQSLLNRVKSTKDNLNVSSNFFYENFIEADFIEVSWKQYDSQLTSSFLALDKLVRQVLPYLSAKFSERLYWDQLKLWGLIGSATFLLLITSYLYAAVFYSISRLIRQFTHKAKKVADGDWSVELSHDTHDEFTDLYSAFNDMVIQLRNNQKQLLDAEKVASMGSMIAGMAHEMNTPIGIAQTSSNLISEDVNRYLEKYNEGSITRDDFERMMKGSIEGLQLIERNLQRCTSLINTLKQLNIYQSENKVHELDICPLLDRIIANLELDKRYPDVGVVVDCEPQCHWEADPDLISLVFKSIISNALDHGLKHKDDTLAIHASNQSDQLVVTVEDKGHGVNEEHLDKVINPFYTTKRHAGHVGLGLHIAYVVTTQTLNGTFKIESQAGEGTLVTLVFSKEQTQGIKYA